MIIMCYKPDEYPSLITITITMNKSGRLLLLLIVGIVAVTQFYRQDASNAVDDAYSRILAVTLDPALVPTNPTRTTTSQLYCTKPRN